MSEADCPCGAERRMGHRTCAKCAAKDNPGLPSDLDKLAAIYGETPIAIAYDIGLMVTALEVLSESGALTATTALTALRSKFVRANIDKRYL